jgi:hypothetical protein
MGTFMVLDTQGLQKLSEKVRIRGSFVAYIAERYTIL